MKKQMKLTAVIFLSIFAIVGCDKEDMQLPASSKKQSTLTELFKSIAPPRQNFSVTAGQLKTIVGEKGTNITFYPNSFKKKDGTILTSGSVTVVLQEMLTGPEMLLAGKTTTSDGNILISGGQFYINATFNNDQLLINQDAKPLAKIPTTQNSIEMNLFRGNVKANNTIQGDTIINWEIGKDTVKQDLDTINLDYNYSFGFESFGYFNCDRFYDLTAPKTEIKVKTPKGFDHINTQIYVYFKSINSVIKLEGFDKTNQTFFINHATAPIGLNVTIVIVSKKDNKHYLEVKPNITITTNYTTSANPTESTEAAIKAAIKAL
jgi:hypothetical protein